MCLYHRLSRLFMNENKSGKLKTCKTYQKEPIFQPHVRRLLKGQEPIFRFALPTDQLLIYFHDKQSVLVDIYGLYLTNAKERDHMDIPTMMPITIVKMILKRKITF